MIIVFSLNRNPLLLSYSCPSANACGELLNTITDSGFSISGALSFHFSQDMAGELLDVYSAIYPSYSKMIDQVCSGLSLALLITGPSGKNSLLIRILFMHFALSSPFPCF
jgi:hypothetical protein